MQLAAKNNVSIDYQVGQLPNLNFEDEQFDAIALIYAHFPPNIKSKYHRILDKKLKKGGIIIFEAFGKNNIKYRNENPKIRDACATKDLEINGEKSNRSSEIFSFCIELLLLKCSKYGRTS